ncbi:hypothetical protein CB0940_09713 [Cercospora beticola]|uniref:Myb-like domain-containing protein n=1 Tax=Cercospora beticola TaxID=122368 RepID=A0A2G5HGS1_CERBT|nr:hypothetical protein CB0940_09713 [Cercospora beticola]PIA91442.1 hypothetical protein CB0940_09713 [Cercospora beticola]WPB05947.1 hypothetical protein RHO25_010602 [Cercospora beticola]CAK1365820.1 unnamed protein product [Cercospora beticola]
MPVNWDETKERQFLLAIITANPVTPNWDQVAQMLNTQSGTDDYVGNALRQKFAKLKKNATDQYGDFGAAATAAPTPAKKTTKRKSAKKEDDEEGEPAGPKSKKAKTAKKSASVVEEDDE